MPIAVYSVKVLDRPFPNVQRQIWTFRASGSRGTLGGSNANVRLPGGKSKGKGVRRLGSPSGHRQQAPCLTLGSYWTPQDFISLLGRVKDSDKKISKVLSTSLNQ